MEFRFQNVNDAFRGLVDGIHGGEIPTVKEDSRNGPVLRVPEPVTICYMRPWERVLFNPARDCNPFFHLYEALWMLAGRNDVESVAYYASNMKNYSDDGKTLNGAYGYRWRNHWGVPRVADRKASANFGAYTDQLQVIIDHLKAYPDSRRAVLQMWSVEDDLLKVGDPVGYSKDVCCNLSVMFSLRPPGPPNPMGVGYLDMTVTNRSNDLIWGTLGANVVHFSFLQEYMAACIGVRVGKYYQFINNLHVYESNWEPEKWLSVYQNRTMHDPPLDYTQLTGVVPLVENPQLFDRELPNFVDNSYVGYDSSFFFRVARPALEAFRCHKEREYAAAINWCHQIQDDAWGLVCTQWINRRLENWSKKKYAAQTS